MDLSTLGRSMEDAFFRERDAKLVEQRKKLEQLQKDKEQLAEVSGIRDQRILDKLVGLKVSPGVLASLSVVPLVEIAWADGELHAKEREAVLKAASKNGLAKGSIDYELLESWLTQKPPAQLLEAWLAYIEGLHEVLTPAELKELRSSFLDHARDVAQAAGGFMGLGSKISLQEMELLKKMERAFKN